MYDVPHELDPENISDREIAADIAYGFSSSIFLDEMEKSHYHIESAKHSDVDYALEQMTESRTTFSTKDLDARIAEAIKEARGGSVSNGSARNDNER